MNWVLDVIVNEGKLPLHYLKESFFGLYYNRYTRVCVLVRSQYGTIGNCLLTSLGKAKVILNQYYAFGAMKRKS